jgi:hypothetical protein
MIAKSGILLAIAGIRSVQAVRSGDLLLAATGPGKRTIEIVDGIESFINYHSTSTYGPYFRTAIAQYRAFIESLRKTGRLNN